MRINTTYRYLLLVLLVFYCAEWAKAEPASSFDNQPRYHLKVSFDTDAHFLSAVEKVRFVNTTGTTLTELHFNIYPNKILDPEERKKLEFYQNYFKVNMFPNGIQDPDFKIKTVEGNGRLLQYAIEGPFLTVLNVSLDSPLKQGEEIEITIEFTLKLPNIYGILGYYRDVSCLGHWYPELSVYKDNRWHDNPLGIDHQPYFSEASYYDVELTLDSEEMVAHTGELIDSQDNLDGTKTLTIKTGLVRDFTFTSSPLYKILSAESHGVKVNLFYLPTDEDCAQKGLSYALSAMDFYIKKFGPYPYSIFNIAETHIGWLGNEFSNIIFIDSRAFNLPDVLYRHLDFLISHEMAHQWWYLQVGSDQFSQTWLDEAFASYAGTLYLESKYGRNDNYLVLPKWCLFLPNTSFREARIHRYLVAAKNNSDEKILQPINEFDSPASIFVSAYDKGTLVIDMLRYLVGDDDFFKIMRVYIDRFRYKIADVKDFISIAEEVTNKDLQWFFDQWLTTTDKCDYGIVNVKQYYNGDFWTTDLVVKRYGEIKMPVEILVQTEKEEEIIKKWDGMAESETYSLETKDRIVKILIDPNQCLLDYRLQNNYWPQRVRIKPTPYYPILYDFPVLNPSDAYSVVVGTTYNVYNAGFRISGRRVYDYMSYLDCRYDFQHEEVISLVGHNIEHVMGENTLLGFELGHTRSVDSPERFNKARTSFTKQLGPTIYSIDKLLNDVTFYFERNKEIDLNKTSINNSKVGLTYNMDYRMPGWDPVTGVRFRLDLEKGSEFLGANTDFVKTDIDVSFYKSLWNSEHICAVRLNIGLSDGDVLGEELFKLGGKDTLRGYGDEKFESKNKILSNIEYRFPLIEEREESILRNFFTFNKLNGAVFYDAALPWDRDFDQADMKSNVGVGLRMEATVLGFFEKVFNRLDVAVPLESPHDVHVWFEITHAF